ncbi:MAG: aldo/keto reductase [Planctomycetota bacterium]|jgi:aryl-alcohol dehydrogenase-like predicted oxidoreductase
MSCADECVLPCGRIEGIEKPVSRLVAGTMMLHSDRQEEADVLLDALVEQGVTTFDTGHIYGGGGSERALGHWMESRGNQEKVVILSKCCHHNADRDRVTPADLTSDLYDSLARLKTDCIDLYVLHRDDPTVPVGPIVEEFNRHCDEGRIRGFGGSNWHHTRVAEANEYAEKHGLKPFTISSPNFSLAAQVQSPWGDNCVSISGPENEEARAWYRETGMPVFGWSSMARGFFSGRWDRENYKAMLDGPDASSVHAYCHEENFVRLDRCTELAAVKGVTVAQIALAWVLNQGLDLYALVGCYNGEEFAQCREALTVDLTSEECAWLNLQGER